MVDWENYASALTAKFRQLYSRTLDSKALFEVYSAVKDDPVFKQTWDQLKVEELGEERLLLSVPNAGELYFVETFLKFLGNGDFIGVQLPGMKELARSLVRWLVTKKCMTERPDTFFGYHSLKTGSCYFSHKYSMLVVRK